MKRYTALTCIVLLMLAGCNTPGVNTPTPPNGSEVQAPPTLQKETFPLVSEAPAPLWGSLWPRVSLTDGIVAALTANGRYVQYVGIQSNAAQRTQIPLSRDGYVMEILVNKQYAVDGLPRVESETWRLDEDSGKRWRTNNGMIGYQFWVVIDEVIKQTLSSNELLKAPIIITLPGVKKDNQPVPVKFEFRILDEDEQPVSVETKPDTPDEVSPSSKYGLVFEGQVIHDRMYQTPKPEWINKNMELVVCSIPGDFFADHIVSLYDAEKAQIRFTVDIKFSAGYMLWVGWLNDQEFYIANNYSLLVFNTNGEKREILRLGDLKNNPDAAIHGLAWSRATQTMAVVYGTGHEGEMELRLMTDHFKAVKTIAVVDYQWPWKATEGFTRQRTSMTWDDRGERLAFTKNKDLNLAIYDARTGMIEDVQGVRQVRRIAYNPETKEFVTSSKP